jgi:hypothetical protein
MRFDLLKQSLVVVLGLGKCIVQLGIHGLEISSLFLCLLESGDIIVQMSGEPF